MVTSGIEELDKRLGNGLVEGRFYLLSGSPGAGKTSACIHFLDEALEAGENCALLTQENPADVLSQSRFLGCDLETAAEDGRLAVLQYRLDFAQNYARVARPERVAEEMVRLIGDSPPRRLVVDTILPFVEAGSGQHGAANALLHLMEHYSPTAYFTLPGDVGDTYYARAYDTIVTGAAGIFHFMLEPDGVRRIEIRKNRQGTSGEGAPLRFVLRPNAGVTMLEHAPREHVDQELSRRIVILDPHSTLSSEIDDALSQHYEVTRHGSIERAFGELSRGQYGLLLITLDPMQTDHLFDLVRSVRAAGNGAPILFVSPTHGLRGATRARGLRAGGDDFIADDLSPNEFLARIEAARRRGHRSRSDNEQQSDVLLVQPLDEEGRPLPIDESELARAVQRHMIKGAPPFFVLVELETVPEHARAVWLLLSGGLRLADGDLIARRGNAGFTMYLNDISRQRVRALLDRILAGAPPNAVLHKTIHGYPVDERPIRDWLEQAVQAQSTVG